MFYHYALTQQIYKKVPVVYNPLVFPIRIFSPLVVSDRLKTFVSFDFNHTFILSNQISISMDTANRVFLDELYFVASTVVDWIDIFTRLNTSINSGVH